MDPRPDLKSLPFESLLRVVTQELGERRFHARQIYRWLHQRRVKSFDEMTDLSKELRGRLSENYQLAQLSVGSVQESRDGTVKFLFTTLDGNSIESVYIPEWRDRTDDDAAPDRPPTRQTLCVSSQVGCAMGCGFCLTATMGLVRNLSPGEMVEQVHQVNDWLRENRGAPEERPLGNLVFMGMGEPLHNFDNLKAACEILLSQDGPNFSNRKITVSTSGLVPAMLRLGEETTVKLAVSLTGTTDEVRDQLMPINKKWPIAQLLDACRSYPLRNSRRVTFEYVLLGGLTDSLDDAERLASLLADIPAKVNLIAYNENSELGYERPDDETVRAFHQRLLDKGLTAVIRRSRGRDIRAACGQLAVLDAPEAMG